MLELNILQRKYHFLNFKLRTKKIIRDKSIHEFLFEMPQQKRSTIFNSIFLTFLQQIYHYWNIEKYNVSVLKVIYTFRIFSVSKLY